MKDDVEVGTEQTNYGDDGGLATDGGRGGERHSEDHGRQEEDPPDGHWGI